MFGMLRPCAHGAAKYGIDTSVWQSHMCGLCLGLRDGHGQLARIATNTDAIVLSLLTEAQTAEPVPKRTAGPCPLRGMRTATIPAPDTGAVRLAATASLLLGAAKIGDHIADGELSPKLHRPMARVSANWAGNARRQADLIGLDVAPLVAAIEAQGDAERRVAASALPAVDAHRDAALDELTTASRRCAAELFAHTAVLAGRPSNVESLRTAGGEFGRIAHLVDAVEDYAQDQHEGRFNPLVATGTSVEYADELLRESDTRLRGALAETGLHEQPTVRWLLLDPLAAVLRRIGHGVSGTAQMACGTHQEHRADTRHAPYPRPPRKPGMVESIGLLLGQYCTGYACCAEHRRPCSGVRKKAWCKRIDPSCCECCNCCNCSC